MVIELYEPDYFRFSRTPEVGSIRDDFDLHFFMDWEDSGESPIKILGYKITLDFLNSPQTILETSSDIGAVKEAVVTISKNEKSVSYEIHPITTYKWDLYPEEFQKKYILKGTILLEDIYLDLHLKTVKDECLYEEGKRRVNVVSFASGKKDIGRDLKELRDPLELPSGEANPLIPIFVFQGQVNPNTAKYIKVGEYTIDPFTGKAALLKEGASYTSYLAEITLLGEEYLKILEAFVFRLENMVLLNSDSKCFDRYADFDFTIIPRDIKFKWSSETINTIPTIRKVGSKTLYRILIKPNDSLRITSGLNFKIWKSSMIKDIDEGINEWDLTSKVGLGGTVAKVSYSPGPEYESRNTFPSLGSTTNFNFPWISFDGPTTAVVEFTFSLVNTGPESYTIVAPDPNFVVSDYTGWEQTRVFINRTGDEFTMIISLRSISNIVPTYPDREFPSQPNESFPETGLAGSAFGLSGNTRFTMGTSVGDVHIKYVLNLTPTEQ